MSRRRAGKFLFVNLYSAQTGDYKLTTRQEQETFLPHCGLEPSFVRYLSSCCRLPVYCSLVVCKFVIRFLCSLSFIFDICFCALFVSCFPVLSAFLLSTKRKITCHLLSHVTDLHLCITTFYLLSSFRQKICLEQTHPTLTLLQD